MILCPENLSHIILKSLGFFLVMHLILNLALKKNLLTQSHVFRGGFFFGFFMKVKKEVNSGNPGSTSNCGIRHVGNANLPSLEV